VGTIVAHGYHRVRLSAVTSKSMSRNFGAFGVGLIIAARLARAARTSAGKVRPFLSPSPTEQISSFCVMKVVEVFLGSLRMQLSNLSRRLELIIRKWSKLSLCKQHPSHRPGPQSAHIWENQNRIRPQSARIWKNQTLRTNRGTRWF
jgi:hypothetical protein